MQFLHNNGNPHYIPFTCEQVRIASAMVNRLGVKKDRLVVLTQYRLQRAQITDKLKKAGLEDVAVSTVITSQGSSGFDDIAGADPGMFGDGVMHGRFVFMTYMLSSQSPIHNAHHAEFLHCYYHDYYIFGVGVQSRGYFNPQTSPLDPRLDR